MKKQNRLQAFHTGISLGIAGTGAFLMTIQDIVGKGGWIEFVNANWINLHPIVGLIFLALLCATYFLHRKALK